MRFLWSSCGAASDLEVLTRHRDAICISITAAHFILCHIRNAATLWCTAFRGTWIIIVLFYTLTMFLPRLHRFEPQPRQQLHGTRVQAFELLNVLTHKRACVQCKSWYIRTGGMKQGEKSHVHRNSASRGEEEAPVAAFHHSERLSAQFGAFQCTAFYTRLICKNILYFFK